MRDIGRSLCYGIESEFARVAQPLSWEQVMRLVHQISADPVVRELYPELRRRPLKVRPTGPGKTGGSYEPATHRVRIAMDSQTDLMVYHELAHAMLGEQEEKSHGLAWREAFMLLLARHDRGTLFQLVHGSFIHAHALTSEKGR